MNEEFVAKVANTDDFVYLDDIINEINQSARLRKTGIEDRTVGYLKRKINERFGIIVIDKTSNEWAGFSCLEVWNHDKYVSNTALIIRPKYRGKGLLKIIKRKIVDLAKESFPDAKLFSLSANASVLKVNKDLGYKEVTFDSLRQDILFIEGNESEVDYFKLMEKGCNSEGNYVAMILDLNKI